MMHQKNLVRPVQSQFLVSDNEDSSKKRELEADFGGFGAKPKIESNHFQFSFTRNANQTPKQWRVYDTLKSTFPTLPRNDSVAKITIPTSSSSVASNDHSSSSSSSDSQTTPPLQEISLSEQSNTHIETTNPQTQTLSQSLSQSLAQTQSQPQPQTLSQSPQQTKTHTVWCGSVKQPILQRKLVFRERTPTQAKNTDSEYDTLAWLNARCSLDDKQRQRLCDLLSMPFDIVSKDGEIAVSLSLFHILTRLRQKVVETNITPYVNGFRLIGSAATAVLCHGYEYNDIDIVVYCRDKVPHFDYLLKAECVAFAELINETLINTHSNTPLVHPLEIKDRFFYECCRVHGTSPWSLVAVGNKHPFLLNDDGNSRKPITVDIKFVFSSERTYDFSVSSFEISLDALLNKGENFRDQKRVMVECLNGDYEEALYHCVHHILTTRRDCSTIARGLIRYSHAVAKGLKAQPDTVREMERQIAVGFLTDLCGGKAQFVRLLLKHCKAGHTLYTIAFLNTVEHILLVCVDIAHSQDNAMYVLSILSEYLNEVRHLASIQMKQ